MAKKDLVNFPGEGLIKTTDVPRGDLETASRVQLNRRGNELFNAGRIEEARRLFQTTGYSDGLIRVGDWYREHNKPIDALKMYKLAHDDERSGALIEKMAAIVQNLLHEEDQHDQPIG
ncbi:MAG: hypothetical protein GX430_03150 [Treponema sp.]|nr:hypothetical protein [Treponema sp.]